MIVCLWVSFFPSNGNFDEMFFKFVFSVLLNLPALCLFLLFLVQDLLLCLADCHEWWSS